MKTKIKLLIICFIAVLAAVNSKNTALASDVDSLNQTSQEIITDGYESKTTAVENTKAVNDLTIKSESLSAEENTAETNGTAETTASAKDNENTLAPSAVETDKVSTVTAGTAAQDAVNKANADTTTQNTVIKTEKDQTAASETAAAKKTETKKTVTVKKSSQKKEIVSQAAKKQSYSQKDLRLLACLVYAESGNQPYKGKLAVANVVLNRLKSKAYSHCDTIKEVIYDHKWAVQFSVTIKSRKTGLSPLDKALKSYDTGKFNGNQQLERKAMNQAIKAARAALEGENNIGSYLCFNAGRRFMTRIKNRYSSYKIIGAHIFYRTK